MSDLFVYGLLLFNALLTGAIIIVIGLFIKASWEKFK